MITHGGMSRTRVVHVSPTKVVLSLWNAALPKT